MATVTQYMTKRDLRNFKEMIQECQDQNDDEKVIADICAVAATAMGVSLVFGPVASVAAGTAAALYATVAALSSYWLSRLSGKTGDFLEDAEDSIDTAEYYFDDHPQASTVVVEMKYRTYRIKGEEYEIPYDFKVTGYIHDGVWGA